MARVGDLASPVLEAGPGLRLGWAPPPSPAVTVIFLMFALLAADLAGVLVGLLAGVLAGALAAFGLVLAEG